jgi:ribosomal protein S18 acetylase RimI-like enzyme
MLSEAPSIVKATSMSHPLDNPVWHALTGPHAQHAIGVGLARHYRRAMTPFSGIATETPAAYTDLSTNLPPNTEARHFSIADKPPPDGWTAIDAFPMLQMVAKVSAKPVSDLAPTILNAGDIEAMVELVALAKPGPFGARTPELGVYLGVREHGRLVAMAGERMHVSGHVELSTICTHPDVRGRGLAAQLMLQLMRHAWDRGEIPFLHVRSENEAAVSLYQRLGFEVRREMWVLWRKPLAKTT